MSKQILLIIVVIAVVVGGGAFYGGVKYAENKSPRGDFSARGGSAFGGQNLSPEDRQQRFQELGANVGSAFGRIHQDMSSVRGSDGFTGGEIISKDDKSVTIKLQDGGSRIVFFSDSTEVMKSTQGSLNDLTAGAQISVNGAANSDGSVTAQTIQLRLQL